MCEKITLQVDSTKHNITTGQIFLWEKAFFAREWFEDAIKETTSDNAGARRREILFSVCCAEAYLLEWVRDQILNEDFTKMLEYFPPEQKKGITEKWKEIPKALYKNGLIPACPGNSDYKFQNFRKLVSLRDNLVHAKSSRPSSAVQSKKENPSPTLSDLQRLKPGWAIEVLLVLMEDFHKTTNTTKPNWMTYKEKT